MHGGNWPGLEKEDFVVQHGELYILGTPVQLNQGLACTQHQDKRQLRLPSFFKS